MIKICKFGGSSLASAEMFRKVKNIILADDARKVVVCSAVGKKDSSDSKITDLLYILSAHLKYNVSYKEIWELIKNKFISIRNELNLDFDIEGELAQLEVKLDKNLNEDFLISRGEYLTSKMFAKFLGYEFVDSATLFIYSYDGKIIEDKSKENVVNAFKKYSKIVVSGFYGSYENGDIKLFSRGGSDITGAYLASYLNASVYENWTDVSGILQADPRIVKDPKVIDEISYRELRELSYMGANVLHEETIFPVMSANIPINLKNTNRPEDKGTFIKNVVESTKTEITGIAGKKGFMSFNVIKNHMSNEIGFLRKALSVFEKYSISVEHVPSSIDSFSVIVPVDEANRFKYEIASELKQVLNAEVEIESDIALISIVGKNLKGQPGILGKVYSTLGKNNINVRLSALGPLELSIILGVEEKDYNETIISLYNELV